MPLPFADTVLDIEGLRRGFGLPWLIVMRYNRLILIQPQFWHTAGPGFGDSVRNGRLVYLMFFNRIPRTGNA